MSADFDIGGLLRLNLGAAVPSTAFSYYGSFEHVASTAAARTLMAVATAAIDDILDVGMGAGSDAIKAFGNWGAYASTSPANAPMNAWYHVAIVGKPGPGGKTTLHLCYLAPGGSSLVTADVDVNTISIGALLFGGNYVNGAHGRGADVKFKSVADSDATVLAELQQRAAYSATGLITAASLGTSLTAESGANWGGAAAFANDDPSYSGAGTPGVDISGGGELPYTPWLTGIAISPTNSSVQAGGAAVPFTVTGSDGIPIPGSLLTVTALTSNVVTLGTIDESGVGSFTPVASTTVQRNTIIRVSYTDPAGTIFTADLAVAVAPAAPPTVSLSASTNTVTQAGSVTVTANVAATAPASVASVQFFLDGVAIGNTLTAAPWSIQIPFSSSSANGQRAVTARVNDSAGATALSAPTTINVAIPAVVTPTAPGPLQLVSKTQTTILFQWTPTFPEADTVIERIVNGVATTAATIPAGQPSQFLDQFLTAGLTYSYRAKAVYSGQSSGYTQPLSVATDPPTSSTAPASMTLTPQSVSGSSGQSATLTVGPVLDANGAALPNLQITLHGFDPAVVAIANASARTDAAGVATFTLQLGAVTSARSTLIGVTASDGAAAIEGSVPVFALPGLTLDMATAVLDQTSQKKYATDVELFVLDFGDDLAVGESLVGPPSLMEIVPVGQQVTDAASIAMLYGAPVVLPPNLICQFVQGGIPGRSYYLRTQCSTSIGQLLTEETRFSIYPAVGRKA